MRIAIAIDGSDHCLRALKQALAFANKMKESSTFVLVNVHLSALLSPVARGIDRQQIEQYMNQIAEEELAEAKKILAATGHTAQIIKGHGEVAPVILDLLKKEKFDLLVVGGKGRGTLTDLLLGSVATKLVNLSPIPVLVVK